MTSLDVAELVRRAQSGERAAFDELVRRFEGKVYRTVALRLGNASDAREVTQDVFLRAYAKLGQLQQAEHFPGWLRRIAQRMAVTRAVRGEPVMVGASRLQDARCDGESDPLSHLLQRELVLRVRDALGRLRALDRETLVAFYLHGRSLREMSRDFRSPPGTIKRRLHVARKRLREALSELQPV